jgi:hypothetical protein
MVMEYLTLVIGVLIPLTQDVLRKVLQQQHQQPHNHQQHNRQKKLSFVTSLNATEILWTVASPPRRSVNKLEQSMLEHFHHAIDSGTISPCVPG